jgi:hypothetical protein
MAPAAVSAAIKTTGPAVALNGRWSGKRQLRGCLYEDELGFSPASSERIKKMRDGLIDKDPERAVAMHPPGMPATAA